MTSNEQLLELIHSSVISTNLQTHPGASNDTSEQMGITTSSCPTNYPNDLSYLLQLDDDLILLDFKFQLSQSLELTLAERDTAIALGHAQ